MAFLIQSFSHLLLPMFIFVYIVFVLDVDDDDDEPDDDYGDGDLGGDIGGCGEYCAALHAFKY